MMGRLQAVRRRKDDHVRIYSFERIPKSQDNYVRFFYIDNAVSPPPFL